MPTIFSQQKNIRGRFILGYFLLIQAKEINLLKGLP